MKTYILDVRSPEEYKEGFMENAINLPLNDLMNNTEYSKSILEDINKNEDEIKVYCFSGARAGVAKQILDFMEYKKVINLGGIN